MTVLQLELSEALTERLREVADERNLSRRGGCRSTGRLL
jgi:predicted transcriptional regulator